MIEENIDYSKYTLEELKDALRHIDRDKYPERVKSIEDIVGKHKQACDLEKSDKAEREDENEFGCLEFMGLEFLFWFVVGFFVLIAAMIKSSN